MIGLYLNRTRAGLAVRAVGESPATADSMGVGVASVRYAHVVAGGVLAGAAGAYLVLGQVPSWSQDGTTSGLGWIALALVVFASWKPSRVLLGAFLFGFSRQLNFYLQGNEGSTYRPSSCRCFRTCSRSRCWWYGGVVTSAVGFGVPAALGLAYVRDER